MSAAPDRFTLWALAGLVWMLAAGLLVHWLWGAETYAGGLFAIC